MSKSGGLRKYKLLTVVAILAASVALAFAAKFLNSYRHRAAASLVREGESVTNSNQRQALLDFHYASLLQPHDASIIFKAAELYESQNQPDAAIEELRRLPLSQGGQKIAEIQFKSERFQQSISTLDSLIVDKARPELYLAKSRALLEMGQGSEAAAAAQQSLDYGLDDPAANMQLGLSISVSHQNKHKLDDLIGDSGQPYQVALKRAQVSKLALAQILYQQGLLRSAKRILQDDQAVSSDKTFILASVELHQPTQSRLKAAQAVLEPGVQAFPADLKLHQLLLGVYQKQGNHSGARQEQSLINQLQTGKI